MVQNLWSALLKMSNIYIYFLELNSFSIIVLMQTQFSVDFFFFLPQRFSFIWFTGWICSGNEWGVCDERGQLFVRSLHILEERKVYNELSEDCRKKKGDLMFEGVEYRSDKVSLKFLFISGVTLFTGSLCMDCASLKWWVKTCSKRSRCAECSQWQLTSALNR